MGEKMSLRQDIRHLIYLDTQFGMRGETDLKLPEIQALEARGWVAEGEDCEYVITEDGERIIEVALTQAQAWNGGLNDRETFESCYMRANEVGILHKDEDGEYTSAFTKTAWSLWKERNLLDLTQPAQAVDVGAIQRVIDELRGYCEASDDSCYGTLSTSLVRDYADKLTAALPKYSNPQEDTPDAAR